MILAIDDFFLITCEHGGNRIPPCYRGLFHGHEALLRTHRAYDPGALRIAREMAASLPAPLLAAVVSRLVIDLNRSPGHPHLFSAMTGGAPQPIRDEIFQCCYLPYRLQAQTLITEAIAGATRVIHLSCHSFTPVLNGKERNADIGLLYDPARSAEAAFCRHWQEALQILTPALKTRMNSPYRGTSDGLTSYLRRRFAAESYLGIELEINQKHVLKGGPHWRTMRRAIIEAFHTAALREDPFMPRKIE